MSRSTPPPVALNARFVPVTTDLRHFREYRGLSALNGLSKSVLSSVKFDGSGHLAVVLHNGRQLVVFDRVPDSMHLDDKETHKLSRLVRGELTKDYFFSSVLAVRCHSSPLVAVHFSEPSALTATRLRLISIYSDGYSVIWNWDRLKYAWQYHTRLKLSQPPLLGLSSISAALPTVIGTDTAMTSPMASDSTSHRTGTGKRVDGGRDTDRDGALLFCSLLQKPTQLSLRLTPDKKKSDEISGMHASEMEEEISEIRMFAELANPCQYVDMSPPRSGPTKKRPSAAGSSAVTGDYWYALMVDYMCYEDSTEVRSSAFHTCHRSMLGRRAPALASLSPSRRDSLSTRFVVTCCRMRLDTTDSSAAHLFGAAGDPSAVGSFSSKSTTASLSSAGGGGAAVTWVGSPQTLMDSVEEMEFWKQRIADSMIKDGGAEAGDSVVAPAPKCALLIEALRATMLGFAIEVSVQKKCGSELLQMADGSSADVRSLSEEEAAVGSMQAVERLLYYVAPNWFHHCASTGGGLLGAGLMEDALFDDYSADLDSCGGFEERDSVAIHQIGFPQFSKCENAFDIAIGQHSSTGQLLALHSASGTLSLLSETPSACVSQTDAIQVPEWLSVCTLHCGECLWKHYQGTGDGTAERGQLPEAAGSGVLLWAFQDWVCVSHKCRSQQTRVAMYHLTNVVLHRRHQFYQWRDGALHATDDLSKKGIGQRPLELLSPHALYSGALYSKHCALDSVPPCVILDAPESGHSSAIESMAVIPKLGVIIDNSVIFELDASAIASQISSVGRMLRSAQRTIAGLNGLTRWKEHSANARVSRSKFLTDFIWRQRLARGRVTAAQLSEALCSGAPLPLLVCLLWRAPHFDKAVVGHYTEARRNEGRRLCQHYGAVFGRKVALALLKLMDALRTDALGSLLPADSQFGSEEAEDGDCEWKRFMAEDLPSLKGEAVVEDLESHSIFGLGADSDGRSHGLVAALDSDMELPADGSGDDDSESEVDIDTIRALSCSHTRADLGLLEKKLKLSGLREDPFDASTFRADTELLSSVLLLPHAYRSATKSAAIGADKRRHTVEMSTPLRSTLAALCRLYDFEYPLAIMRLVQVLCHGHSSTAPEIASRVLTALKEVSHGLKRLPVAGGSEEHICFHRDDGDCETMRHFAIFEQRIVCRVILCKMANLHFDMLDFMLRSPLTESRLSEAIKTSLKFEEQLDDTQKALIFKRLLDAWILAKLQKAAGGGLRLGCDWIPVLRPKGYNGFHLMQHLAAAIGKQNGDKTPPSILARAGDIPVKAVRSLLLFFAKELQPLR